MLLCLNLHRNFLLREGKQQIPAFSANKKFISLLLLRYTSKSFSYFHFASLGLILQFVRNSRFINNFLCKQLARKVDFVAEWILNKSSNFRIYNQRNVVGVIKNSSKKLWNIRKLTLALHSKTKLLSQSFCITVVLIIHLLESHTFLNNKTKLCSDGRQEEGYRLCNTECFTTLRQSSFAFFHSL